MKKLSSKLLLLLGLLFGSPALELQAQYPTAGIKAGALQILGDNLDGIAMGLGFDAEVNYAMRFADNWRAVVSGGYYSKSSNRTYGTGPNAFKYSGEVTGYSVGAGARFYLANTIDRYKPYRGQFLPYLQAGGGALFNEVEISDEVLANLPQGFTTESSVIRPFWQFTLGSQFVLATHWRMGAYLSLRGTATDFLDGLRTTTGKNDWQGRAGVEINYVLFAEG